MSKYTDEDVTQLVEKATALALAVGNRLYTDNARDKLHEPWDALDSVLQTFPKPDPEEELIEKMDQTYCEVMDVDLGGTLRAQAFRAILAVVKKEGLPPQ